MGDLSYSVRMLGRDQVNVSERRNIERENEMILRRSVMVEYCIGITMLQYTARCTGVWGMEGDTITSAISNIIDLSLV